METIDRIPLCGEIAQELVEKNRKGLAARVEEAISRAEKSTHQEQVDFEYQIQFYASIFDMDKEIWKSLFPDTEPSVIIQDKIPEMVKVFERKNKPKSIGITCYYLQTKDEMDNDPFVKLGWYNFDKDSMEEIRSDGKDIRSLIEIIMRKPVRMAPGEFLHYFVGEHGVTEKGIAVIDTFNYSQGSLSYRALGEHAQRSFESMFLNRSE